MKLTHGARDSQLKNSRDVYEDIAAEEADAVGGGYWRGGESQSASVADDLAPATPKLKPKQKTDKRQRRSLFLDPANEPALRATLHLQGDGPSYVIKWPGIDGTAVAEFNDDGYPVLTVTYTSKRDELTMWRAEYSRVYAITRRGYHMSERIPKAVLGSCQRQMLHEGGLAGRKLLPPSAVVERVLGLHRAARPLYEGLRQHIASESPTWHKLRGRERVMVPFTVEWALRCCTWPADFKKLSVRRQKDLIAEARALLIEHGVVGVVGRSRWHLRYFVRDEFEGESE